MKTNNDHQTLPTKWNHYLFAFLAGIFIINIFPHFIHGIIGKSFPTPFANPPGKGLSSPVLNIVWAMINFLIGFSILYFAKLTERSKWVWIAFFGGVTFMSFYLATYFGSVMN